MSVQQGYAAVGALRMYYEVHGETRAGRAPLVLVHGGGSTIESNFGALIPLLTVTRQVIGVEEQGHGHTASADDIAAVLDRLEVPSADVLGFSSGAGVSLRLAMRHPSRVRRLIVASTFYRRDGVVDGFWDGMQDASLDAMPEALKEADRKVNPDPRHLEQLFEQDRERTKAFQDWSDAELQAVTSPTLVVAGDQDIVKPEHAVRMARAIPGARLLVVPANHGNYLGEVAASAGDTSLLRATVPFLTRFLDEDA
jgi:pimeloyl-ACP methyl ester carboxylesterase